ncbi:MAG: hypothetical protein ONB23_05010 [candidate division KSB1 bacterium]|nr:hypothetical protein [candidate division KSB1 bacterium]
MRQVAALDYAVIVFYLATMLWVGLYFRDKVRSAADYFAGGNLLPWWVSGISLYMSTFSAWTFSGAAGFVYDKGYFGLIYFATWSLAFFIGHRFTAARWRRARVISPIEYLATRYNATTRQLMSWIMTISSVLTAGITLTAVSKIVAAALRLDQTLVTVTIGAVMILYTYLAGLWGVAVTDVVQFMVLLASTVVILPLSLQAAGGLPRVIQAAPPLEWDFTYHGVHYNVHWLLGVTIINIVNSMSLLAAQRYYSVRDEKAARHVGLSASLLFLTVPILFGLPPLAGRVLWPSLEAGSFVQTLGHTSDLIYVRISLATLPNGLIGLFLAAMFAATMSTLDTTFNVVSAVAAQDIYKGLLRPEAEDREVFLVGRVTTLIVGLTVTGLAIWYARSSLGIFNLMALIVGLFQLPLSIPVAVGLLSRRVARWSATAAMSWGFATGLLAQFALRWPLGFLIYGSAGATLAILFGSWPLGALWRRSPVACAALSAAVGVALWFGLPAAAAEPLSQGPLWATRLIALAMGGSLFAFARRFADESEEERRVVEEFFRRLATPVDVAREVLSRHSPQSSPVRIVGLVSLSLGMLVLGLLLFPSGRQVWPANAAVGAVLVGCGACLVRLGRLGSREQRPGTSYPGRR